MDDLEKGGRVHFLLSGHYHPGASARSTRFVYSTDPAFCKSPIIFYLFDVADPYDIKEINVSLD